MRERWRGALPRKDATAVPVSYQPVGARLRAREDSHVLILRRVLKIQAAVWALTAIPLVFFPVALLDALGQLPVVEAAWLRMLGIASVVLAMLMWLVAGRLDAVWWWAWAFVVLEVGVATLSVVNALFGLDPGVTAWPWWAMGGVAAVFAALDMLGLGRTSQEKPQV